MISCDPFYWCEKSIVRLIEAVQQERTPGPLRRTFKLSVWNDVVASLADGDADRSLARAATLIYEKAEAIRSSLRFANQSILNSTTRLRALVAFANHNSHVLDMKAAEVIREITAGATVGIAEISSARVRLPDGFEYSPNEIMQTLVDGVQVPLRFIFADNKDSSPKPRFNDVNWNDVQFDANLGVLYLLLEGLWDDCLWNDLRVVEHNDTHLFEFADRTWEERAAISECRIDNLRHQFFAFAGHWFKTLPYPTQSRVLSVRPVVGITHEGRHRRLELAREGEHTSSGLGLALLRLLGQQPYYGEILSVIQPSLSNANLQELISAWAIVSSASEVVSNAVKVASVADDARPERWLPSYAPILELRSLVDAVVRGAGLPKAKAEALLHFLIYRGEAGQELWTQPLVEVAEGRLAPVFGAALFPNLSRLIDRWMQQLGVDMSQRGPAFEQHIREHLAKAISASRLRQDAAVLPSALNLRPAGEPEEEIDVVFVLGPIVFVCEVKCVLFPTEPKQKALYRKTITGAADQINRKAAAIERHREVMLGALRDHGISVPKHFSVIKLVVLNSEMQSGFRVEGVTIVDENILRMFFEGEIVDFALERQDGRVEELQKRSFYSSSDEALVAAPTYFESPPQLDAFKAQVRDRITPVPAISDSDWSGYVRSAQCVISTPALEPRRLSSTRAEHI
jgi:hypothetical protein